MKKYILMLMLLSACGSSSEVVKGTDGTNGQDGRDGNNGIDGTNCSVSPYVLNEQVLGAIITCTDGSSSIILNRAQGPAGITGQNGHDGEDGKDGRDGEDGKDGCNDKD